MHRQPYRPSVFTVALLLTIAWSVGLLHATEPLLPPFRPNPAPEQAQRAIGLDDLIRLAEERNPRLAAAAFAAEVANGKAEQAGLYPILFLLRGVVFPQQVA